MKEQAPEPTIARETRLWACGYRRVAGLDEVGRGAWAGPVVAAAVVLPPNNPRIAGCLAGVRDSKELTPARREALFGVICHHAVAVGVGAVSAATIDTIGIVPATRRAMARALASVLPPADYLLIDYLSLPEQACPQECLPKGDAHVLSIAAASIVAKVCRDRFMARLDAVFPGYDFGQHKGYGTHVHQAALAALGPCACHRISFAPLKVSR
ncbi:MAG TPA: ribonuclease HII [Anaerolineae bacterium]|nr:ribonuclease HII [Anaerolineae bacterium]